MSPFFVVALCMQFCLLQTVMSQTCGLPYGPGLINSVNLHQPQPQLSATTYGASYGGSGTGKVGVSGDIGASGQTVVVGAVPVLGSVDFRGTVPASGSVSISGQCECACN